jgi:hypothetical protein
MAETTNFINLGYGWFCKRCSCNQRSLKESSSGPANFFREGEAEDHVSRLSDSGLARWKDETQRSLVCDRCNVEDGISGD